MGLGHRDIFKVTILSFILTSLVFADGADTPEGTIHSDKPATDEPAIAATTRAPEDLSKVRRILTFVSRGNDDPTENRQGVYETAKVKFGLVLKEDKGRLQIWMEIEPTLSTSELKGARLGLKYGARASSLNTVHYYSDSEKVVEKARLEKAAVEDAALEKKRLDHHRTEKVKLAELAEKEAAELKQHLDRLLDKMGADAKDNKETIDHLTKLIARAVAAQSKPNGSDPRAERLPVGHLKKLLQEAEARKIELGEPTPQVKEAKANFEKSQAKLETVNLEIQQFDRTIERVKPRPVETPDNVVNTGNPNRNFVPFKYADDGFRKVLNTEAPQDPKGQSMSGTVYVGEVAIPTEGKNEIQGMVNIENGGQSVKHRVFWRVNTENGKFTEGKVVPIDDPGLKMWQVVEVKTIEPDGEVRDNPFHVRLENGFIQKPFPESGKPVAMPGNKSIAIQSEASLPR